LPLTSRRRARMGRLALARARAHGADPEVAMKLFHATFEKRGKAWREASS
jgi:hypothetical protein